MYEFLRILPMSIADLLNEWFESELLKAAIAASSMLASFVGPRQQGTATIFCVIKSAPPTARFAPLALSAAASAAFPRRSRSPLSNMARRFAPTAK